MTLSFIPTLGTMVLGLAAGRWLRSASPQIPMKRLLMAGAIGIASGLLLHATGICPIVKRIWTPGWTLFTHVVSADAPKPYAFDNVGALRQSVPDAALGSKQKLGPSEWVPGNVYIDEQDGPR